MRILAVLSLLMATGCNIFPEMHYSPAQRRGEPARLAPPSDAVPITGATPRYTFDQAATLAPRDPPSGDGAAVYRTNCGMCHGADGRAQTLVSERFGAAGAIPPVDLTSPRVTTRTDGQLFWLIANGIGNMPPFGSLLTENELWLLVAHIRQLSSG